MAEIFAKLAEPKPWLVVGVLGVGVAYPQVSAFTVVALPGTFFVKAIRSFVCVGLTVRTPLAGPILLVAVMVVVSTIVIATVFRMLLAVGSHCSSLDPVSIGGNSLVYISSIRVMPFEPMAQ